MANSGQHSFLHEGDRQGMDLKKHAWIERFFRFSIIFFILFTPGASTASANVFQLRKNHAYFAVSEPFMNQLISQVKPSLHCFDQKFDTTIIRKDALYRFSKFDFASDGEGHIFLTTSVFDYAQTRSDLLGLVAVVMAFAPTCAGKLGDSGSFSDELNESMSESRQPSASDFPQVVSELVGAFVEGPLALVTFDVETLSRMENEKTQRNNKKINLALRKKATKVLNSQYLNQEIFQLFDVSQLAAFKRFLNRLEANNVVGKVDGALLDKRFWEVLAERIRAVDQPAQDDVEFKKIQTAIRQVSENLASQRTAIEQLNAYPLSSSSSPHKQLLQAKLDKRWADALKRQEFIISHNRSSQFLNSEVVALWELQNMNNMPRSNKVNDPYPEVTQEALDLAYLTFAIYHPSMKANGLSGIGGVFYRQLNFTLAEEVLKEGLDYSVKVEQRDISPFYFYELLRNIYLLQGRYEEALVKHDMVIKEVARYSNNPRMKELKDIRGIIEKARDLNLDPAMLEYKSGIGQSINIKGSQSVDTL